MKCIRCGAEVKNGADRCSSCFLEFTDEMKAQMVSYEKQMEEYNRQMEEYNLHMSQYNGQAQANQPTPEYAYGNVQQSGAVKRKYIPNILTMLGVILAIVSIFLPYAKQGNATRSIWEVFGKGSISDLLIVVWVMAILLLAFICSFFKITACRAVNLICSLGAAGLIIFEFILTVIDKQDYSNAALAYGSIISVVAACILIIAVPVWSLIFRKK